MRGCVFDRLEPDGGPAADGRQFSDLPQALHQRSPAFRQGRDAAGDAAAGFNRAARHVGEPRQILRQRRTRAFSLGRERAGEICEARQLLTQTIVDLLSQPLMLLVDRLPQRPLEALALRNVLDLRYEIHGPAGRISNQRHGQQHPHDVAILVQVALFHVVMGQRPIEHLPHVADVRVEIILVGDGLEIAAEQFLRGVADDAAQRPVDPQPTAVRGDQRHADGREFEGASKSLLTLTQIGFHVAARIPRPRRPISAAGEYTGRANPTCDRPDP